MFFVYKPRGLEDAPQKWEFAPQNLMNAEAEAIEKVTGMTFAEWSEKVLGGSMTALHALLWVMLKRERPTLRYGEVEFTLSEVDLELDDEESAQVLAALEEKAAETGLAPAEQMMLDKLRESAPAADPVEVGEGEAVVTSLELGEDDGAPKALAL